MNRKRKLKDKIIVRINKSKKNAFVPSDFFDFSDRDQVGRVLRELVQTGYLVKLGQGVFAKTKVLPATQKRILAGSFPSIVREALTKLRVRTFPSRAEQAYNAGTSTQVPTGLMIAVNKRVTRNLSYKGRSIKYEYFI